MIYYVWWARTGNATYLSRANAMAVDYRDRYIVPANFGRAPTGRSWTASRFTTR